MAYRNRLIRTEDVLEKLEEALVSECGDMSGAAEVCQVPLASVYFWMEDDEVASKRLKQAQLIGWSRLESAAYERAVKGIDKAVYFKGQVVGYETVYSDGLLQTMLKARLKAYKADVEEGPKMVVNIMPRAESYEEWVLLREQTLKRLPAPTQQVEYTDYEPVTGSMLRDVL